MKFTIKNLLQTLNQINHAEKHAACTLFNAHLAFLLGVFLALLGVFLVFLLVTTPPPSGRPTGTLLMLLVLL